MTDAHDAMDLTIQLLGAIDELARIAGDTRGVPWDDSVPGMVHADAATIAANKHAYEDLGFVCSADRSALGDTYRRHIVHNDPAATVRRCAADRRTVNRHQPRGPKVNQICQGCGQAWPCADLIDRVEAYGLSRHLPTKTVVETERG